MPTQPKIKTRDLHLAQGSAEVRLPIIVVIEGKEVSEPWITAKDLREQFYRDAQGSESVSTSEENSFPHDAGIPQTQLWTSFLAFVTRIQLRKADDLRVLQVLCAAYSHFVSQMLLAQNIEIHGLVDKLDADSRRRALHAFYSAREALRTSLPSDVQDPLMPNFASLPQQPMPAMVRAGLGGSARLFALFGGQGVNETYFDDIVQLQQCYGPLVDDFVAEMSAFLSPLVQEAHAAQHYCGPYAHGIDVSSWLRGQKPAPSIQYLASVPVSLPLIGLGQMMQYLILVKSTELSFAEASMMFCGATGHSQGIVTAVALAASHDIQSFVENSRKCLKLLFLLGLRASEASPMTARSPELEADSVGGGEGIPSSMLSVVNISQDALEAQVRQVNNHLAHRCHMQISLYNGPKAFVVTGPPESLFGLAKALRDIRAPSGLDQSKIPYCERKPNLGVRFLAVFCPYHSSYLKGVAIKICQEDLEGDPLWKPSELRYPVYGTEDGSDLRCLQETTIANHLVDLICTRPLHWREATFKHLDSATHMIDFGLGGLSGIGPLTARNIEGLGVRSLTLGSPKGLLEFYDASTVVNEVAWAVKYAPQIVQTSSGQTFVDTKFSRLIGKPPIMVAGMTPCTVNAALNIAVMNAGYHIELAGGGHFNADQLTKKIEEIRDSVVGGNGITLNSLYINQRQWTFQYPLVCELARKGYPIDGLCIAAGIPSNDVYHEIIKDVQQSGMKHISFKPGTIDGIRQVVSIALSCPEFPVIMQWTGGRSGGHHSYEDFFAPLLATYAYIRSAENLCLVVGGGFGTAQCIIPWLTGKWSTKFGVAPMPCDGVLLGSRIMVAKEAQTARAVKELICQTPGLPDERWHETYRGEAGGVITVKSELGEPIHKVATRGVLLWRELDDQCFSLPLDKRREWIQKKKQYLIKRLNDDFQKVWFPVSADGTPADSIDKMSYILVAQRLVQLMFIKDEKRWIDISLRNMVGDWLRLAESRFTPMTPVVDSILPSFSRLDEPISFLGEFVKIFPMAALQRVKSEDVQYLFFLCRRPGQKPTPFIFDLGDDFHIQFKKDSLWQAEDLAAVPENDAQRVAILQGPVSAQYNTLPDEPVADILNQIHQGVLQALWCSISPTRVEFFGPIASTIHSVSSPGGLDVRFFNAPESETPTIKWLQGIVESHDGWIRALLLSKSFVQGRSLCQNPFHRILKPRVGQLVEVSENRLALFDKREWSQSAGSIDLVLQVEADYDQNDHIITVKLHEEGPSRRYALELLFRYRPHIGYAPIEEVMDDRERRVREFYCRAWFGSANPTLTMAVDGVICGPEHALHSGDIDAFCKVIGNEQAQYLQVDAPSAAPLDYAIKIGWQAIMSCVFADGISGDLLRLVHLGNSFVCLRKGYQLRAGDRVTAKAQVTSNIITDAGRTVEVKGTLICKDMDVLEVTSRFLFRGAFTDYQHTFHQTTEPPYQISIRNATDVAMLRSKAWLTWEHKSLHLEPGIIVLFEELHTTVKYKTRTKYARITMTGVLRVGTPREGLVTVGNIAYDEWNTKGNPVLAYLHRHGSRVEEEQLFLHAGYSVTKGQESIQMTAPASNEFYSAQSEDRNPIHTNPFFAALADLPGTITHGMWTSAATRRLVEIHAADNVPSRIMKYAVSFVGMVLPGESLRVELKHFGMKAGRKLISILTLNEQNEKVLTGVAEIEQVRTAYVFTGQGSQIKGMGMELYERSATARRIWDEADEHLFQTYGFSILDIVRRNPRTWEVRFGGPRGERIRANYMALKYETIDGSGCSKLLPLFPDINIHSHCYSFRAPEAADGLLFATQFAQPALCLVEKAAFEDLRANGLVQADCPFAGHSLGEYAALASVASLLPVAALVDIVFYRGMTMQVAVDRDSQSRSQYGMVAVDPSRVGDTFDDAALRQIVLAINKQSKALLEIVNYNIENRQYVAAGERLALDVLANTLNVLRIKRINLTRLLESMTTDDVKKHLDSIISEVLAQSRSKQADGGFLELTRGYATVPLTGIDVPFHSSFLWPGVTPFRTYLSSKIDLRLLDADLLIDKYIPNLTALPFNLSRSYIEKVYHQTSSTRLAKVLASWDEQKLQTPQARQLLAYDLLIELLSYQFASPVRWIETQDQLFSNFHIERLIEIGPQAVLSGMAIRTLKLKYSQGDSANSIHREALALGQNQQAIYYDFRDEVVAHDLNSASAHGSDAKEVESAKPTKGQSKLARKSFGHPAEIADAPLEPSEILRVIIAQKLKKPLIEIPLSKSIRDLAGGKSTLQNELIGDLQAEFGNAPEKGEDLSLQDLGSALAPDFKGQLGKHTSTLISRMFANKMPGSFSLSDAKTHLRQIYGLAARRVDAVLLLALTYEPPTRLTAEDTAKDWLGTVTSRYAESSGIELGSSSRLEDSEATGGIVAISDEALAALHRRHDTYIAAQMQLSAQHLQQDLRAGHRLHANSHVLVGKLQSRIDAILQEHGEIYLDGIMPAFKPLQARVFNSWWNWAAQDAVKMYYEIIDGRLTAVDRQITARCLRIINRADTNLVAFMQYVLETTKECRGPTYRLAKELGHTLLENCRRAVLDPPRHIDVAYPTAPRTVVTEKGDIVYQEAKREGVRKMEDFVKEQAAGGDVQAMATSKIRFQINKLYSFLKQETDLSSRERQVIRVLYAEALGSIDQDRHELGGPKMIRCRRSSSQFLRPNVKPTKIPQRALPFLHLRRKRGNDWQYSERTTALYLDVLKEIASEGTTFKDKTVLMTGVGQNSIGVQMVEGLLAGGAQVIITTSSYSKKTTDYYKNLYQTCGSKGSALYVVPFNQASRQDIEELIEHIYHENGFALDLDYVVPFAAISENGREIDAIDDRSELAHRLMMTNVLRLLGAIKSRKAARRFLTRPTQVILPLSPNHGTFGGDGLYGESKIALETLLHRWASESWGDYLSVAGAVIGWTRGTGLMSTTDQVAESIEQMGCRTYSSHEMAFAILGLMHPLLVQNCLDEPLWADLSGGLCRLQELNDHLSKARARLQESAEIRRAISMENRLDVQVVSGSDQEALYGRITVQPRVNIRPLFPRMNKYKVLHDSHAGLQGMLNLDKVVVIVGFGEVSPWGSARTRWAAEKDNVDEEALFELAWMMGKVKHYQGRLKTGQEYVGWVDAISAEPLSSADIRVKYGADILAHCGIRPIEKDVLQFDPNAHELRQEIQIQHDLQPFESSLEEARMMKKHHGDYCDIWQEESGSWKVQLKRNAKVSVSKSMSLDRFVSGQLPSGWTARRYGLPEDLDTQLDEVSKWNLISQAEALASAGIEDSYELLSQVHCSEYGTSVGSGMGGQKAMRKMFLDRKDDKDVPKDILQETFINTAAAAWANMLMHSSSGPVLTVVGACATAAQSAEVGVQTILSGRAKAMWIGGVDDHTEESTVEFANMRATMNNSEDRERGRLPEEASRPWTSTRAGFVEGQGGAAQLIMTAALAIKMGLPIYGILAKAVTATDKQGKSVPAPGRGTVAAFAKEFKSEHPVRELSFEHRRKNVAKEKAHLRSWLDAEIKDLHRESLEIPEGLRQAWLSEQIRRLEQHFRQKTADTVTYWQHSWYEGNCEVSPLRGALSTYGLTVDDISVVCGHYTSTTANDESESNAWQTIFEHTGRSKGNLCPMVAQKSLIGHLKGGAAAAALNSALQMLQTGFIPGNAQADNIDQRLRKYNLLRFPSKGQQTADGIRAVGLSSFGFGQAGAMELIVHPDYVLASLDEDAYNTYAAKRLEREHNAHRILSSLFTDNNILKPKTKAPYTDVQMHEVYLNPLARAELDKVANEYTFPADFAARAKPAAAGFQKAMDDLQSHSTVSPSGIGFDTEKVAEVPNSLAFRQRNFTPHEISHCESRPNPSVSFAGRWCAKEAIAKALGSVDPEKNILKGAGVALIDIEIRAGAHGAPEVVLHGQAQKAAENLSVAKVLVSITHGDDQAYAIAHCFV